jgi:hypothetical protein
MENKGKVTSAPKRMIGYISSFAAGCQYCQAHTIRAAERYEAEEEKLSNIWEYKSHPSFSDAERAALDFSMAASTVPNNISEDVQKRLHEHWDEGEIVEMLGVISLFGFLNRWNDSMSTTLEEGEEGAELSGIQWLAKKGWAKGSIDSPNNHSYDTIANLDDNKKAITVNHLLSMTGGMKWKDSMDNIMKLYREKDWSQAILNRKMSHQPGKVFNYDSPNAHLLSVIIQKVSKQSTKSYADKFLFQPLGITIPEWEQTKLAKILFL